MMAGEERGQQSGKLSPDAVTAGLQVEREHLEHSLSSQRTFWRYFISIWIMVFFIFSFIDFLIWRQQVPPDETYTYVISIKENLWYTFTMLIICIPLAYLLALFVLTIQRRRLTELDMLIRSTNLEGTLEDDFFNKLVKINFKYIDQYYLQTQRQANKSFWLAACVSATGFLFILAGIIFFFSGRDITPAALASIAGILSEFIGGVFFYLYNRTIIKMAEYHQKLVLTQNIGLALKITESFPHESKVEVQRMLIDRLTDHINQLLCQASKDENEPPHNGTA